MKIYVSNFLLFFISLSGRAEDDCQPDQVKSLASYVGAYYKKTDVSLNIQELKSAIRACNYTYRDLGVSPDFYTDMKRESYCQGLNQEILLKFSDIFSAIGNPGFTLCRKLGNS